VSEWIKVCRLEEIPQLGARVVETAAGDIAVFRTADDAVFAVEDKCPHKGGPLSQGIVFGHSVTCPLHGWIVGLESGEACAPDRGCTRRLPVRVDAGEVMLALA
jgi:nitrite reductase (NADH) small subunit